MKGCRPLNREERKAALLNCKNTKERALLAIGFATGYRISELLSLRICDVINDKDHPLRYVSVKAGNMKGGEGRTVLLNTDAGKAVQLLAKTMLNQGVARTSALFQGEQSGGVRAVHRVTAWRWLVALFKRAEIFESVSTHTLRKTFASEMYRLLNGAIEKVQIALGHKNITSTMCYLSFNTGEIDDAMERL
jgi:integrase